MEEIRQLVFKEILGTITVAERERLFTELERNEEARKMMESLNTAEVRAYFEKHTPGDAAGKVLNEIHFRKKAWLLGRMAVAAAMIGLVVSSIWIFREKEQIPVAGEEVQLIMPGGERVALGNEDKQVNVEGVRISNRNKQLRYEAGMSHELAVLNVPAGKDHTITLSDGTVVQLNAGSKIRFPLNFTNQSRDVFIEGEAYIDVVKDAKRPFTVHLPGANVQVLGTAFNVNTYDSRETKVSLVAGVVRLVNQQDSILLKPGEEAVADGHITVSKFDQYETLSWREGKFVLNNVTMEEVCKIITRWFGVVIEMDTREVSEKHFSGVIDRNQAVEQLLKGLKATNGIDYYWTKGVIHIR